MKNQFTLATQLSGIEGTRLPRQSTERVESILDFDSSGAILCHMTEPLINGLDRPLDPLDLSRRMDRDQRLIATL